MITEISNTKIVQVTELSINHPNKKSKSNITEPSITHSMKLLNY